MHSTTARLHIEDSTYFEMDRWGGIEYIQFPPPGMRIIYFFRVREEMR
jgi:hypothetical protein